MLIDEYHPQNFVKRTETPKKENNVKGYFFWENDAMQTLQMVPNENNTPKNAGESSFRFFLKRPLPLKNIENSKKWKSVPFSEKTVQCTALQMAPSEGTSKNAGGSSFRSFI